MDLQKVTRDAFSLSVQERGILAAQLLESIESSEPNDTHTAWLDHDEKRLRDLDEGRVRAIGEDEVARRVRARIE